MDVSNFLKIDAWYKAVGIAGAAVCGTALTIPLQIPNGPVALMGLGGFLFGLGEWINHPLQTRLVQSAAGWLQGQGYLRSVHWGGLLLDIAGAGLVAWGAVKLVVAP